MNQILQRVSDFFYPNAGWFGLVMIFGVPWSHAFFYIGLVGMLACLLAAPACYSEFVKVCQEHIGLVAVLFFAYIAAGLLYTHAPMDLAVHDVKKYRKLLLIPVFLLLYRDAVWAKRLVIAYSSGVFVLMLPTLLDGTGLAAFLSIDLTSLRNETYSESSLVYWRNHIVHGFHASMLFAICLLSSIRHRKLAWLFLAVAAICLANILLFIHGRVSLFAVLAVCLLMAISYMPSLGLRAGVVLALLAGSICAYQFSGKIQARVDSVVNETRGYAAHPEIRTSAGTRLHYWSMSLTLFKQAPLFGRGPGTFRESLVAPDNPWRNETHTHAHNEYLTLLSQHGVLGLLLFVLLVHQIYRRAGLQDPWLKGVVRFGLVIFLINALTDSSLNNESEGWTFVFLASLANIGLSDQGRRNPKRRKLLSALDKPLKRAALATTTPRLSRPVSTASAQEYIDEVGYGKLGWRALRRRMVFWASGQAKSQIESLQHVGKRGLWIYSGEGQIGDALMDLAPRSLLQAQGFNIDLLTDAHLARLFRHDPWFSIVTGDVSELAGVSYDFVIVLSNKRRSLLPKIRHFKTSPWVSILEDFTGPNFDRAGYSTQRLADLLGLNLTPEAFAEHARQKLRPSTASGGLGQSPGHLQQAVALSVGGVDPLRTYTDWAAVMAPLIRQGTSEFILLGSANGLAGAKQLEEVFGSVALVHNYVGKCSLEQSHALIATARVVVCVDGGLMHLAATTETPLIGLFSASIQPQWRLAYRPASLFICSRTTNVNDVPAQEIVEKIQLLYTAAQS